MNIGTKIDTLCTAYETGGEDAAREAFKVVAQGAKAWEARAIREHFQGLVARGVIKAPVPK